MAIISDEIRTKLMKYVELLESNGFPIKKAYLYGSYSNESFNDLSDIDIAILSEKFEGNRFLDRMKIAGLHRQIDDRISPLPIVENDIADSFFIQSEVIAKGIRIY